jgi:hypothetical protein
MPITDPKVGDRYRFKLAKYWGTPDEKDIGGFIRFVEGREVEVVEVYTRPKLSVRLEFFLQDDEPPPHCYNASNNDWCLDWLEELPSIPEPIYDSTNRFDLLED